MRKFIIDTDTASDDAVALVLMLRAKDIEVLGITCVAGNVSLPKTLRNARVSCEIADTYTPKFFAGCDKPMFTKHVDAENCHGHDGLGDIGYPEPKIPVEEEHAVDAVIRLVKENPGIEILTLGPLTNIAMAIIQEPELMRKNVARLTAMGGQYKKPLDWTANAEFNIWQDVPATKIVLESGIPITMVPLDVCVDETFINRDDMARIRAVGTKAADFFIDCNRTMISNHAHNGFCMPDPTAAAVVIDESVVADSRECFTQIEVYSRDGYGQLLYDFRHLSGKPANCRLITKLHSDRFKQMVIDCAALK